MNNCTAVGRNVLTLNSNCLCSASLSNKFIFAPNLNEQNRHRSVNAVKFNSSLWGSCCCCWFVNIALARVFDYWCTKWKQKIGFELRTHCFINALHTNPNKMFIKFQLIFHSFPANIFNCTINTQSLRAAGEYTHKVRKNRFY